MALPAIGVRWTVGDAAPGTLRRLERSMRSVHVALRGRAELAVCVRSVGAADVREQVRAPDGARVAWLQVDHDVPLAVRRRVDLSMAGGVAWRFAPLRVFDAAPELLVEPGLVLAPALARRVLRWAVPGQRRCLVARRPARAAAGRRTAPAIALRGLPPSFDLEDALEAALAAGPRVLASAEDAFAVELLALSRGGAPVVVAVEPRAAPAPVCG